MPEPKIVFFLGAGASAFMGLPATKPLMESFLVKHQSCNFSPMIRDYKNKNIENLYADVNELLNSQNMVLHHIPIMCATNEIIEFIEDFEYDVDCTSDTLYDEQLLCDEHPLLESLESESRFESVYDTLEQLKHSLGQHVFESLRYDKNKLSEYCMIIKQIREVADSYPTIIITTNYDLLIENCCDSLGLQIIDGFSKMPSGRGKWDETFSGGGDIKLLKLHGSLNWHKESDGTPVRESAEMQYDPTHNIWIEPSPQKVGTNEEPLKTIRTKFENILHDCDLLVVIGFSFNDDIWKNIIQEKITKEGNKMRLLYISKSIPIFINSYGSEFIIDKNNHVGYKDNSRSSRKTRNNQHVEYFISAFDTEHSYYIFEIIKHVKNRVRADMQFR